MTLKSKVYLSLFHGRTSPDEQLSNWGKEGPILGPFDWIHTTYRCEVKCGQDDGDYHELTINEDCLYYDGIWYGDWSVFAGVPDGTEHRLVTFDDTKAALPAVASAQASPIK